MDSIASHVYVGAKAVVITVKGNMEAISREFRVALA